MLYPLGAIALPMAGLRGEGVYGGLMKDRKKGSIDECPNCGNTNGKTLHLIRIGRGGKSSTMICGACSKPWTAVPN